MVDRGQSLLAKSYVYFAALAALLALTSACSRVPARPFALKAIFGPVLIQPRLQVGGLDVIADSKSAMVFWDELAIHSEGGPSGVAAVDRRGRVAFKQIKGDGAIAGEADGFEQIGSRQMGLIDAETAVVAGPLYQLISKANRGKRRPFYKISFAAALLKKGKRSGRPLILGETDLSINSPATFRLTEEAPGRFSVIWQDRKSVKKRDFVFEKTGPGRAALKPAGPVVTLSRLSGLAGADGNGNLYIVKTRPVGKKDEQILVTKIGKDSQAVFKDLVVGRRRQPPANLSAPIQVITGTDSIAVIWLAAPAGPGLDDKPTYMFRQVNAYGRFLGGAARLKPAGPGGFRIRTTESRIMLGNTLAVSRRKRKNILAKRFVSWKQLDQLEARKQPLFSTVDATGNEFLLRDLKDFIRPAGGNSYGQEPPIMGAKSRLGVILEVTVSRASTDTAQVTLADPEPNIMIDFYQFGRLVKTLNLGRGEDVALAAAGSDFVVAWTGGPGWVGLKLSRWRLIP